MKFFFFHFYPFDMLCTFCGACISVPIQLWPPWPFIHYIQQKGSFNLSHFNYVLLLRTWKEYWYDSHTNPWFIPIVVYILKLLCKEQTITRRKIKKDLYSFSDLFFFFTKGEEYGWLGALNCFHQLWSTWLQLINLRWQRSRTSRLVHLQIPHHQRYSCVSRRFEWPWLLPIPAMKIH